MSAAVIEDVRGRPRFIVSEKLYAGNPIDAEDVIATSANGAD